MIEIKKDITNNMVNKKINVNYIIRYQQNKNDFEAFEVIYNFYKDKIYRFSYSFLKDNDKAEEVVQETFIKVINKIQTLKNPEVFNIWIYRISYSLVMIHFRKEKHYQLLSEEEDMSNFSDEKENQIENYRNTEIIENVKDAFEILSDRLKITAELYYFENMKIEEISNVLGIPEGTVKSRLKIIRETVQEQLKKKGIVPSDYLSLNFVPLMWGLFEHFVSINQLSDVTSEQILEEIIESTFLVSTIVGSVKTANIIKKVGISTIIATVVAIMAFRIPQSNLGISKIIYNSEMTRNKVEVTVISTKETDNDEVLITKDKQEIAYSITSDVVKFEVSDNGKYIIRVGEDTETITVDFIDQKAPVTNLESADEKKLKLKISDDFSGVDFKKSYVMSNGNRYTINEDGLVNGLFLGEVEVYLYDNVGNYSEYVIRMKG